RLHDAWLVGVIRFHRQAPFANIKCVPPLEHAVLVLLLDSVRVNGQRSPRVNPLGQHTFRIFMESVIPLWQGIIVPKTEMNLVRGEKQPIIGSARHGERLVTTPLLSTGPGRPPRKHYDDHPSHCW